MSWSTKANLSAGDNVLEHDEKGEPDRIREQRFAFGIDVTLVPHHWVRHAQARRLLATRLPSLKRVQADSCDDRSQPAV
jgi:hypothetical protein